MDLCFRKSIFFILLCFGCFFISPAFSIGSTDDKMSLNDATVMIKQKKYDEAVEILKNFIIHNPENSEAHYRLGMTYKTIGKIDEALDEFEKAYELSNPTPVKDPVSTIASEKSQEQDFIDLADVYFENKSFNEALEYYDYALKINHNNSYCLYRCAKAFYELGNKEKSQELASIALKLEPDNAEYIYFYQTLSGSKILKNEQSNNSAITIDAPYYNKQGIGYFKLNELDTAEKYFIKAIDADPNYVQSYNNLATVMFYSNQIEKAIEYSSKAISINPEYIDAYYNLAAFYVKKGDNLKAIEVYDKITSIDKDQYKAYYLKARCLYALNKIEAAKTCFNLAIRYNPEHFESYYRLGLIYANERTFNEAFNYLNKALELNPDYIKLYEDFASIYNSIGKHDEAVKLYYHIIALDSQNFNAYFNLSKIYIKKKDYPNATAMLDIAEKINKNNPEIFNYSGIVRYNKSEFFEAEMYFKKAIELDSIRPIFHYNLSQCYSAMSNNEASLREFQKAINIKPLKINDYLDLVKIFHDKKMTDYAVSTLKGAIKTFPEHESFYIALADIYKQNKDVESSDAVLNELKKINPHFSVKLSEQPVK